MQVKISDAQATLVKIITNRSKLSEEDARTLASSYVEGELQGKKSHGIAAFPGVVDVLPDARGDFKVLKETESFIYADAEGGFGAIVGNKIADLLIDKAKQQGVALAVIRDMKAWLRPATVAQYVAEKDMLGWVVNTGGPPMVAPPGGRDPVVGTNPIGIGIPTESDPVVADMATSVRAWGEVRLAKRFGHDLPADSFTDKEGLPTVDPDAAHAAVPTGGYKGFALGLLIEVMGGSLAGMTMGQGDPSEAYHARDRGALIMVINPDMTVGKDQFKQANEDFMNSIRQTPPAKGSDKVTLPGDRATKTSRQHVENGYLVIDDDLWAEITGLL